jgi:hypothetical protein
MNEVTEAPASMNFRVVYKGIEVQITNRDLKVEVKPFLERAKVAIDWSLVNGFTVPPIKSFGQKKEVKYVEGKVCPKCGGRIVEKTKQTGEIYFKCEKGGWDRIANKPMGCEYVDWNNPKQTGEY